MRILYVLPGMGPCGGIRVAVEHLNRLAERGHEMFVATPNGNRDRPGWIGLHKNVIIGKPGVYRNAPMDLAVATGYATVDYVKSLDVPGVWFNQMAEWMFYAPESGTRQRVKTIYDRWDGPMIQISQWVAAVTGDSKMMVGNGVNKEHFYPDGDKQHAIIIEGDDRNAAKDVDGIGWAVGDKLRDEFGVQLWGYAGYHHKRSSIFDRFVVKPTVDDMRQMYSGAKFLLKVSRYDARACAPVEAMCCGTPTVRGIVRGDDDLIDFENCIRCKYDYQEVLEAGRLLLGNREVLEDLTCGAMRYAADNLNWSDKIDTLEGYYETLA